MLHGGQVLELRVLLGVHQEGSGRDGKVGSRKGRRGQRKRTWMACG